MICCLGLLFIPLFQPDSREIPKLHITNLGWDSIKTCVWQVQHLAGRGARYSVAAVSLLGYLRAPGEGQLSVPEELLWRSVRSRLPQQPVLFLLPCLVPSLFYRWGRQTASLPASCFFVCFFLHSSCSFKVSPLFHLLFFPSLFFIKTNKHFFSGQLRLPGMPVALTASPNGCGSPAFCEMCSTLFCLSMWLSSLLFWGAFCLFFPAFSVSPHLPKG